MSDYITLFETNKYVIRLTEAINHKLNKYNGYKLASCNCYYNSDIHEHVAVLILEKIIKE